MRSSWEGILASIFLRFFLTLGAKLGRKIVPKSIKKGVEKTSKKRAKIFENCQADLDPKIHRVRLDPRRGGGYAKAPP